MTHRLGVVTLASLFALSLGVGGAIAAGGEPRPAGQSRSESDPAAEAGRPAEGNHDAAEEKEGTEIRAGFPRRLSPRLHAGAGRRIRGGLRGLQGTRCRRRSPDVANSLGYTARKLGDYELSRVWYERALASDPKHVRTWQYYGMWHVEQGNKLKAADFLEQIRLICGTECKEYQDLKGGMEGTVTY